MDVMDPDKKTCVAPLGHCKEIVKGKWFSYAGGDVREGFAHVSVG